MGGNSIGRCSQRHELGEDLKGPISCVKEFEFYTELSGSTELTRKVIPKVSNSFEGRDSLTPNSLLLNTLAQN